MQVVTRQYTSFDGLTLKGEAYGDPNRPPVILLHGGGQTRYSWGKTAAKIAAAGWYAIAMDARGHGETDWCPNANYALDAFVGDLRAVIGSLEQLPVVVGASKGGITALAAAGESDRCPVRALVLVDIAPRIEPAGMARIMNFMTARPEGFANIEEVADAVANYTQRSRGRNLEGLKKNVRQRADGRYIWHWDPKMIASAFEEDVEQRGERLLRAARRLTVPVLLVRGEKSDVVSAQGVEEFRDAVRHAEYVDVSGAGHMVAGDQNTIFSDAVIDFIKCLAA